MTLDATLGASTADSYISVSDADAIFAAGFKNAEWSALSQSVKETALKVSTANLEVLEFVGKRCSPATDDADKEQALQWPRHEASCRGVVANCAAIPLPIRQACASLALDLQKNPNAIDGDGTSGTQGPVKKQQLGSLSQEFFEPGGGDTKVSPQAALVLQKFPYLVDLLGCWLESSSQSSRVISRVRS